MPKIYLRNKKQFKIPKFIVSYNCFNVVCKYHNLHKAFVNIDVISFLDIKEMNKTYLNHNKATNIISFPFDKNYCFLKNSVFNNFLGEIFICPEVLSNESFNQNKIFDHHWSHILIHGILHLLGYEHKLLSNALKMEEVEVYLLNKLNIKNPYFY